MSDEINQSSAFVLFPATGQVFEYPNVIGAEPATHIANVRAQLDAFMSGARPFEHTDTRGVHTVISPAPGIGVQILPGSVFRDFMRQQRYAAMQAQGIKPIRQ